MPYLLSIDPDNYIGKISPRPVLMLQGDNDSIVNIEDAKHALNAGRPLAARFYLDK